jgi:hypothetical protein
MMDIDLGPAVMVLIIIFYFVPGVIGFVVGALGGILISKRMGNKHKRLVLALVGGGVCAVLFPVIVINIEGWLRHYGEKRVWEETKKYESELPSYYSIRDVKLIGSEYEITFSVVEQGLYFVMGRAYQGGVCRGLFSKQLTLDSGVDNLVRGELNDVKYDKNNGCGVLYQRYAADDPKVSVGRIDSEKPIDFVIEISSRGYGVPRAFGNQRDGSIIFYSPGLSKNGKCPVYNHMRLSVCVANERLRYSSI